METDGCIDDLENLQTHQNHEIYEQAVKIIEKYFGEEEDDPLIQALNAANYDNNNSGMNVGDSNPGNDPTTISGGLF